MQGILGDVASSYDPGPTEWLARRSSRTAPVRLRSDVNGVEQ